MGDRRGIRRVDGSKWVFLSLCWTVGGMFCYLFALGCGARMLGEGSAGGLVSRSENPLQTGFGLAMLGLVCGFWVWIPVWFAAVAGGWIALVLTEEFPMARDRSRRRRFAAATAAGVALLGLLGGLWISDGLQRATWGDALSWCAFWGAVAAIAGASSWCYYPREKLLVGLEGFVPVPEPRWPREALEYFAEPPEPPGSSPSDL